MRTWYIGAVVFCAAGAVLVLEVIAARILAPYVGVSLQSFTGIIGTVLAAIAFGAWMGGRLADARDPSTLLGPILVVGGLLAVISPALVGVVGQGVHGEEPSTIVFLAVVGFFAPAAVLSLVTPIAAKLLIATVDNAGSVVGNLSAIGTAGALFGTFITGFVLIASVPSRPITWIVGGVLVTLGMVALFQRSRLLVVAAAAAGLFAVVVSSAAAAPCDYETAYSCVQLLTDSDRPSGRYLVLDTFVNSYVDTDDPTYLSSRYARVVDAVVDAVAPPGPLDVAYIGGGGYTMPRFYAATRGGTSTVLELDDALLGIANEHLGLQEGDWLSTIVGDARITLPRLPDRSYDVVFGDAFSGRSVPWHLTTEEFLSDVRDKLTNEGIYVLNTIDHPPSSFVRAEAATIAAVFPYVAVVAPAAYLDGDRGGNFILVGSNQPISTTSIEQHVTNGERAITGHAVVMWIDGAGSLTDDFAPADQLISRP